MLYGQMQGINKNHKRALAAVVKMQELFSKEKGLHFDDISYKIDTKGTVIFSLKSGGTIRDTGTEVHFSFHDKQAQKVAEEFAKMKWNKYIGRIDNMFKKLNEQKKTRTI